MLFQRQKVEIVFFNAFQGLENEELKMNDFQGFQGSVRNLTYTKTM